MKMLRANKLLILLLGIAGVVSAEEVDPLREPLFRFYGALGISDTVLENFTEDGFQSELNQIFPQGTSRDQIHEKIIEIVFENPGFRFTLRRSISDSAAEGINFEITYDILNFGTIIGNEEHDIVQEVSVCMEFDDSGYLDENPYVCFVSASAKNFLIGIESETP